LSCLELAERRRAFSRAFRAAESLDLSRLRGHLEEQQAEKDRVKWLPTVM